jgi:acyl-coenzyme A synthetase/AMP-(fatty) acid ligase
MTVQPTSFRWDVPVNFNFARDVIDELAGDNRRGLLFVDAQGNQTQFGFAEIARESQKWAAALRDQGVRKGDRVIIVLPKIPAWLFAMLGLLRLGAVAIPGAEQLRAKDLLYRANHAGATFAIAHVTNASEVDAIAADAPDVQHYLLVGGERPGWTAIEPLIAAAQPFAGVPTQPDDLAYIVYTSGTTKDPKGVVHRVAYTYSKRMAARFWFDCRPDDLVWCTAGTGWAKSLWSVLLGPWSCGSCIVLHEGGFAPEARLDMIRDLGVTVLCQGEPLNPEVLALWRQAFGITIYDGYGQTENTLIVANLPGTDVRPGSMGKPTPGHDVAVVDDDGTVCEPGSVGNIALRGQPPSLFTGYYKNDAETTATRRGDWYLTGDRARVDEDGYFWFVGRADDVISSGAYRIGPFEVESALLEHPAVMESAVVGSPDPDRGNIVKAFVVLRAGYAPTPELVRALQDHCKRVTAPYKYPREIEFVDELPKTRSGKIRRVELRQLELRRKGATAASGFV